MVINPSPSIENLGGKGYQLSLLKNICRVPEFFVIQLECLTEIETTEFQNNVLSEYDSHEFDYVSIRSSATVEDSEIASFAGMFETKLNVTRDTLIDSIRKVFNSSDNERVIEYCQLNKLDVDNIALRVVVQKMVNCRVAGVCITKETSDSNTMLIEACLGVGEALVSGMITPDTYRINRTSFEITESSIGFQKKMVISCDNSEIQNVPFHLRNAKKMKNSELVELSKICLLIEKKLNYHVADIEWAFEKDRLYILQARPFVGKI